MLSKLVSALDSAQNFNVGENGHVEVGWSNNIEEKILQFYFQLVRTRDIEKLAIIYRSILIEIFNSKYNISNQKRLEYGLIAYKLIAQTRDIISGKGEYKLSHMMIWEWSNIHTLVSNEYKEFIIEVAKYAVKSLVLNEKSEHPLGSWKDIKYLLNYGRDIHKNISNTYNVELTFTREPLFRYAITLISDQLRNDMIEYYKQDDCKNISLAAKWAPREHSNKFGWIAPYIAEEFFSQEGWDQTAVTKDQIVRLKTKKLTQYRIILSKLNNAIDTVQIKQCGKSWKNIDFDKKVTSITLNKQKFAFNNITKKGSPRHPDDEDRVECSNRYTDYISRCSKGQTQIKGKRVSIYDFVKDAIENCDTENNTILDTINLQWVDNSSLNCALENMIALVDTSGSMSCDNNTPLYNAIGLGIRIAEKSTLGKRVMTFSSTPTWINLDGCNDFVSMVKHVKKAPWGMNTNFYAAFNMILEAYLSMDIPPSKVDSMVLTILSDMQIDQADDVSVRKKGCMQTMFDVMTQKFEEAGLQSKYNMPYKLPTVVFWNLRTTNGFPATSFSKNVIMVSGYSPILLNAFMSSGIEALKECTPWKLFIQQLNQSRYTSFNTVFYNEFQKLTFDTTMPPPPPSFDTEA